MANFFVFAILTLAAFRIQRIITSDDWPPSVWFRESLDKRYGEHHSLTLFFSCPWCLGWWVTLAVFAWADYLLPTGLAYPVAQVVAAAGLVGIISNYDD